MGKCLNTIKWPRKTPYWKNILQMDFPFSTVSALLTTNNSWQIKQFKKLHFWNNKMCKQWRKCLLNKKCILKKKIFFSLLLTLQHDICIWLSWFFSANYTSNASPLVRADSLSQPHTLSGRGDAIMWAVTFSAQIECVLPGQRWIRLSAALCRSLSPTETKSPSLLSAFRPKSWM